MEFYLKKIAPNNAMLPNPFRTPINKCHDWRNYIPLQIRSIWLRFSLRERLLMSIIAQDVADNEEWD